MPDKFKDKIFKNPFTGATRKTQKTAGYKLVKVTGADGDIKKIKYKTKSGPHKGDKEKDVYKYGGKIRNMFKQQYD